MPQGREPFDAIVIGSGIGGLSCAAVLAAAGRRVLVLEKQDNPGGCMQAIPEPPDAEGAGLGDWSWNMGIQYLAPMSTRIGPFTFKEIAWWPMLTEPPVQIARLGGPVGSADEHTYQRLVVRSERGEVAVALRSDSAAMKAELCALPGNTAQDRANVERFWKHLDTIDDNVVTLLLPKVLPWPLSRLAFPWTTWPLAPLMDKTMKQVLDETFQGGANGETLKLILSSYWNFLGFPLETNFMFWTIGMNLQMHGVWTPVGGSRPLIEGFVGMVARQGGELRHGPGGDVREVLLEGSLRKRAVGVRCADGSEIRAPIVVSSIGLPQTVGGLLPAEAFPRHVRRALDRHVSLPSNLMLRIGFGKGCDRALVERAIGIATTFRWMDEGAWDMDQDPTDPEWEPDDVLVMFPEFYQAPLGSTALQTCEVVFVTDHRFFRRWTDGKDPEYLAVIAGIARKLRAFFDERFPALAPHVACTWMSHPLEIRDRIHHAGGSIYGLDSYKLIDQDILPRSGVPGLYLTGEDVVAHGVSISAGMTTAGVILSGDLALGLLRWVGRMLLRSPLLLLRTILPPGPTYRLPRILLDEAHPRGRRPPA